MAATVRRGAFLVFLTGLVGSLAGCGSDTNAGAVFPNVTPSPAAELRQATPVPTATPLPAAI